MYFTPQQLSGGPKFAAKTRVGNWSEDYDLQQSRIQDYMQQKENNKLVLTQTQQRFANAL